MKLRNRIHLYTSVLFIGLLILIHTAIYFAFSQMILKSELEQTTLEAERIMEALGQTEDSVPAADLLRAYVPINGMIRVVNPDGSQLTTVTAAEQENLFDQPFVFQQSEQREIVEYDGIPYSYVSVPVIWTNGEIVNLQITESLEPVADNLQVLRIVLIVVTVIATIPVLLSAGLLSNLLTKPISSMIETMREIRKSGHFKRIHLPEKSQNELYLLGETFNEMMDLLEKNYAKQEQFVSNASHELKTPLTIIESYASLLKRRGKKQPELFDESVDAIHSEAIRMKDLIQQLLLLAKHDEQWHVEMTQIPLTEFAEAAVRSFREGYKREVVIEADEEVIVKADKPKLKQLLFILLDNARKYSEAPIQVKIGTKQKKAVIEVIDRGMGIPASELPKVFDRFYRVDRARKRGGYGLGLSLAKELAEVMGAEVRIESTEGIGTNAQIWLPLQNSH
ncbi:MAG TPA: HAMP domain-containing histidine kinase [Bacillus sp. (in: firmicutes)]|uniref:HAMP domain-containing sensor histidine kinase n=1 Tax=Bacillus litorisediminis TaxID=2922713 RepID=UPI001FAC05DF|nr:HAMP domain-containing histidine kinase [Bacillus litorisediminis]HWO74473.1 HAMP domain-containing histidine kinase [Bacillus sp. (in: firmicutes)]